MNWSVGLDRPEKYRNWMDTERLEGGKRKKGEREKVTDRRSRGQSKLAGNR